MEGVTSVLVDSFGAFLVLEIWSKAKIRDGTQSNNTPPSPGFRLIAPEFAALSSTVERLEKELKRIKILKQPSQVEVVYGEKPLPPGLPPLYSSSKSKEAGIYVVGLEVEPIYRDAQNAKIYPLILRNLHRSMGRAFRQAFFEFARTQTSHIPEHYHTLGRRAVVKAVWEVDRQMAEVSNAFDFLWNVTPMNSDAAWQAFRRSGFVLSPEFLYRPLPVEPALLKRALYKVPIERVEDPIIAQVFREKQNELDRKITLLGERGNRVFLYGSMQIFGSVDDLLLRQAEELLDTIPSRSRDDTAGGILTAREFAERASAEIDHYRAIHPEFIATVEVRKDFTGLMVSRGKLLVGSQMKISASRVEALLQHEVGTHLLTYFNGRAQPFKQLYSGMAGYDALQEGLAVLSEYLVGGLSRPRMRVLAARVVAVRRLVEGASFVETFRQLDRAFDFEKRTAYYITMRVYRGGGLTKDAVYLKGLIQLLGYLKNGGSIDTLFVGKIGTNHVPIIRELQWGQVLRPVPLRPRYMDDPKAIEKLNELERASSVLDLVERRRRG
jgi:uncharacterized protein (TIGR02421 family)